MILYLGVLLLLVYVVCALIVDEMDARSNWEPFWWTSLVCLVLGGITSMVGFALLTP